MCDQRRLWNQLSVFQNNANGYAKSYRYPSDKKDEQQQQLRAVQGLQVKRYPSDVVSPCLFKQISQGLSSFCLHQMFFDANRGDVAIVGQTTTTTATATTTTTTTTTPTPNKLIWRTVCQHKRDKQICIPISEIVRDKVVTTTIPRRPKLP